MPIDLKAAVKEQGRHQDEREEKIISYFKKTDRMEQSPIEEQEEYAEQEKTDLGEILHQWQAPEFEVYEKSGRWYIIFALFIIAIVIYALVTNSVIMAITFILLGVVGYIYLQKDPRTITFSITSLGVIADKQLYPYENIKSFWIFYHPPVDKTLSLHTNASMLPFVHIPIANEDPVAMREVLLQYINEKKQDPSLVNTLEKVLHI
jgi:uncharacterized membrane protein